MMATTSARTGVSPCTPPSPTHSQCHASGQALPPGSAHAGWFQPNRPALAFRNRYPGDPKATVPSASEKSAALPQPCMEVSVAPPDVWTTGAAQALLPAAVQV